MRSCADAQVGTNKISAIIPTGFELLEIENKTHAAKIEFWIRVRMPTSTDNVGKLGVISKEFQSPILQGEGNLEELEESLKLWDQRIKEEIAASRKAEGILEADEIVSELIQKLRAEQDEKLERSAAEAEKRIAEKQKAEEERKKRQQIKDSYRPEWLSRAREMAGIEEKRFAEWADFIERWGLTEEQADALVTRAETRDAPYIELSFSVAGIRVKNKRLPLISWDVEGYTCPEFSDKTDAMAEALADVLKGTVNYIRIPGHDVGLPPSDPELMIVVDCHEHDQVVVETKDYIPDDDY